MPAWIQHLSLDRWTPLGISCVANALLPCLEIHPSGLVSAVAEGVDKQESPGSVADVQQVEADLWQKERRSTNRLRVCRRARSRGPQTRSSASVLNRRGVHWWVSQGGREGYGGRVCTHRRPIPSSAQVAAF